jgi:hypothetical protein
MYRSSVVLLGLVLTSGSVAMAQEIGRCASAAVSPSYSPADVEFVVSLLGNVIVRPSRSVTEADVVRVRVLATEPVASLLSVHRTSPARRAGELRVIGLPEAVVSQEFVEDLRTASTTPSCFVDATLGDFRPGQGEVEIRLVTGSGTEIRRTVFGSFDFNVEPVFAGMVSLGPIVTRLPDPTFQVATNFAGETYVAEVESGNERILYALMYTPFVGGKRIAEPALTRDPRSWLRRVNPMFGVVLDDIRRNAIAGLSVDLPFGLVAHYGLHVGRTSEIDPASGLTEGSRFEADGTIPVRRTWNRDQFYGLTLDTRVALRLIGLAGSTTVP